jgi:hypothetical protein
MRRTPVAPETTAPVMPSTCTEPLHLVIRWDPLAMAKRTGVSPGLVQHIADDQPLAGKFRLR